MADRVRGCTVSRVKMVFISHPIRGDVPGNIKKMLRICRRMDKGEVHPVVPHLAALWYLNDDIEEERERGKKAIREYFLRGFVDEVWLYGNCISEGMREEVELAFELGIPVIAKTAETQRDLDKLLRNPKT